MSEIARLTGVFFAPKQAFADIARRPSRWWVPVLLASIVAIVVLNIFDSKVGWESAVRRAMDNNPATANMPLEQREQVIQMQSSIGKYAGYASPITLTIVYLLIAVVLMFLFDTILGADIGFKRMLAIVSYGSLPNLIVSVLTIAVLYMKPGEDIDIQNPLAFNLAAYLPGDAPGWLKGAGAAIDLFSFWVIGLMAIGVSAASRKISVSKAVVVILFPWFLWVCLRAVGGMFQGGGFGG